MNSNIIAVYYKEGTSNLIWTNIDEKLCDLKDQLTKLNDRLNQDNTRKVTKVEYCRLSIDSYGCVKVTNMQLQNDVRTMF